MDSKQQYAKVYGSPGASVRLTGLLRTQWPLLVAVMMAGYLLRAALPAPELELPIVGGLFLVLAIAVAAAANRSRDRLQAFLKGAKGEEIVARELALLPQDYTVFHGVNPGIKTLTAHKNMDLDHVVVGPNGIFLIETKNWTGDITIADGQLLVNEECPTRPPLEQSRAGAESLADFLNGITGTEISIHPILSFASNNLPWTQQRVSKVLICNANQLNKLILSFDNNTLSKSRQHQIISALQQHCEP